VFDSEFAAVVAALGANMVVHDLCTAVAACGQLRFLQRIVRSSLGRTGLRESVFWMWHIITFFYYLFQFFQSFPTGIRVVGRMSVFFFREVLGHLGVAFSFGVRVLHGQADCNILVEPG